jgi:hypothetical protein
LMRTQKGEMIVKAILDETIAVEARPSQLTELANNIFLAILS